MPAGRHFLITGTDTGIGKTTVSCALAAALSRRGIRIGVHKPIETGCADGDGVLVAADAERLKYFSGSLEPLERICPVRARAPVAPVVADRREALRLSLADLAGGARQLLAAHDVCLVEGAGGLLVPITDDTTFADLARECDLSLIVVVGNRLGALNHAMLTLDWARLQGLSIGGYIVNQLAPDFNPATESNVDTLGRLLGPPLGVLPWLGRIDCCATDRDRLADAAEECIDLRLFLPETDPSDC